MSRPSLAQAGLGECKRARSRVTETVWIGVEWLLVTGALQPSSRLRAAALRLFGAEIGQGVILRPRIRVKCPWNLRIGDRSWIGEGVWIHNQGRVTIGADSVVSQETFISTGSHDVRGTMDLTVTPVEVGSGVWITSRCIVLPGSLVEDDVVVTPGSVVRGRLLAGGLYGGNPAALLRMRDL